MHFWIDKRSQACGFNGRHGVPASLVSGRRRRNKSMVVPVHRFQSIDNSTFSQIQRPHQISESHSSSDLNRQAQYLSEPVNEPISSRSSPPPTLDASAYIGGPYEVINPVAHPVAHPQIMRLGGLTKYGMWASFGLTTASVAAAKFYVDYQGTFEILLLCTMGVLGAGLLVSCALTFCKKNTPQQFINVQTPQPQPTAVEMEIPEIISQREMIITPMTNISAQTTPEARPAQDLEQPPPPYHIAILLPLKDSNCIDFPPPSYENAVR